MSPTRPFDPRSFTKAMMLAVTDPKNGTVAANQKRAHDGECEQHQAEFSQSGDHHLEVLKHTGHERFLPFS